MRLANELKMWLLQARESPTFPAMESRSYQIREPEAHDLQAFRALIQLFGEVFEMPAFTQPSDAHLEKLLANPNFLLFTTWEDDEIVGGLTVYVVQQYYQEEPLAHIYDLAVSVAHQRQGIGSKLIEAVNQYCQARGFSEVYVQAEQEDDYALKFYRSTKPTAELVASHFNYILKGS